MKAKYLILAALVLLPMCLASYQQMRPYPFMLSTPLVRWTEVGTITGSQAYPAVGNRDYTTVAAITDANSFTWTIPNEATGFMLSFQTSANADSTTIALMGFAAPQSVNTAGSLVDDDGVYLGQLVLTGGQQVGKHTNVYVDTVVATNAGWTFEVRDSGNDRRCIVMGDTLGFKVIVGVATSLQASSTLYAEARIW